MFFLAKNLRRSGTAEVPGRAERIMKRGKDAEKSNAVNKEMNDFCEVQIRIRSGKNHREYQNDLKSRGQLAENAGRKRAVTGDQQNHYGHDQYQNVAAENDDREPPRNLFLERQNDERRRKQQLIRDGIEICSEGRPLIQAACQQPVNSVRKPGYNENQ